ncbi:uncharacterized protein MONOS_6810 [Monocercomonoides exilis]|uniref:uncharacterized protein n=1 Tax=Monocercomonoides exilis TaxID=2049356 RepID=UPI00355AB203|nr:hypothetical protein MONOS_6810 [Monocercomonoides exilis]|eukprot:MONOS_6810.1-p1 / transcript=MONOS_6810.1 / gene=MONOS_6810 / organism=Monocercomonoides_exilis_PA203 / gene_product=unspecified product / transcript_product=unspecified product / location=Mono_scaffold00222:2580-5689(-) / protein_length=923 / sequence_SO=supercontig / SO=protein_coding / is_pseudo=false
MEVKPCENLFLETYYTVSCYLTAIVKDNENFQDTCPEDQTFVTINPPSLNISQYLQMLMKNFVCNPVCFALAAYYLEQIKKAKIMRINERSIHRAYLASPLKVASPCEKQKSSFTINSASSPSSSTASATPVPSLQNSFSPSKLFSSLNHSSSSSSSSSSASSLYSSGASTKLITKKDSAKSTNISPRLEQSISSSVLSTVSNKTAEEASLVQQNSLSQSLLTSHSSNPVSTAVADSTRFQMNASAPPMNKKTIGIINPHIAIETDNTTSSQLTMSADFVSVPPKEKEKGKEKDEEKETLPAVSQKLDRITLTHSTSTTTNQLNCKENQQFTQKADMKPSSIIKSSPSQNQHSPSTEINQKSVSLGHSVRIPSAEANIFPSALPLFLPPPPQQKQQIQLASSSSESKMSHQMPLNNTQQSLISSKQLCNLSSLGLPPLPPPSSSSLSALSSSLPSSSASTNFMSLSSASHSTNLSSSERDTSSINKRLSSDTSKRCNSSNAFVDHSSHPLHHPPANSIIPSDNRNAASNCICSDSLSNLCFSQSDTLKANNLCQEKTSSSDRQKEREVQSSLSSSVSTSNSATNTTADSKSFPQISAFGANKNVNTFLSSTSSCNLNDSLSSKSSSSVSFSVPPPKLPLPFLSFLPHLPSPPPPPSLPSSRSNQLNRSLPLPPPPPPPPPPHIPIPIHNTLPLPLPLPVGVSSSATHFECSSFPQAQQYTTISSSVLVSLVLQQQQLQKEVLYLHRKIESCLELMNSQMKNSRACDVKQDGRLHSSHSTSKENTEQHAQNEEVDPKMTLSSVDGSYRNVLFPESSDVHRSSRHSNSSSTSSGQGEQKTDVSLSSSLPSVSSSSSPFSSSSTPPPSSSSSLLFLSFSGCVAGASTPVKNSPSLDSSHSCSEKLDLTGKSEGNKALEGISTAASL